MLQCADVERRAVEQVGTVAGKQGWFRDCRPGGGIQRAARPGRKSSGQEEDIRRRRGGWIVCPNAMRGLCATMRGVRVRGLVVCDVECCIVARRV